MNADPAFRAEPPNISAWLVDWIARELSMAPGDVDTAQSLLQYSLSSVTATILVGDLEDWLDLRLPPTLAWDYPSIDAMVAFLEGQLAASAGRQAGSGAPAADADALLADIDRMSDDEVDALLRQLQD